MKDEFGIRKKMTTDFTDGTDGIRLPSSLPLSVSAGKSVVQVGFKFRPRYRSVTVGNGKLFRSDCQTFEWSWIRGPKIKVAQAGSRQIKVAQGILKHFFMTKTHGIGELATVAIGQTNPTWQTLMKNMQTLYHEHFVL
jgi:hypothetical protein